MNLLSQVPFWLEMVVLVATAVTGATVLYKKVYKPIKGFNAKINAGMDTLLGYEAVKDPGSGTELKPATPPLAQRVESLENAMNTLLEHEEKVLGLYQRLVTLEEWRTEHERWSEQIIAEIRNAK